MLIVYSLPLISAAILVIHIEVPPSNKRFPSNKHRTSKSSAY